MSLIFSLKSRAATQGLQNTLGAGDSGLTRVDLDGRADCAGGGFEDPFGNVMRVSPVMQQDVQIASRIGRKGLPEILHQFAVELTDLRRGHGRLEYNKRPTAEVDGAGDQGLLHRQHHMTITANPDLVPQALTHGLAKTDADVLRRVVRVHLQIPMGLNRQIDQGMLGEQDEHMIEKPDARIDRMKPRSIEIQLEFDGRFRGRSTDFGRTTHRFYCLKRPSSGLRVRASR
jgi:hypothetical protein